MCLELWVAGVLTLESVPILHTETGPVRSRPCYAITNSAPSTFTPLFRFHIDELVMSVNPRLTLGVPCLYGAAHPPMITGGS